MLKDLLRRRSNSPPSPIKSLLDQIIKGTALSLHNAALLALDAETCQFLQAHPVGLKTPIALEYIQAWLLVGHYELLRVGEHQAMLTAGRCFRLVLMARLSDIDAPNSAEVNLQSSDKITSDDVLVESFAVVEEQRRTFWLTFCLARFLCSRNEYPLTLYEEMASSNINLFIDLALSLHFNY